MGAMKPEPLPPSIQLANSTTRSLIGWLLDTHVTPEIISPGGSARVKAWTAGQDEALAAQGWLLCLDSVTA
jgi:hypothetical protein